MPDRLATLPLSKRMVAGMSVSRNRLSGTGIRLSAAIAADYFALLKPRVMALAVFTAFVGLVMAPGVINPLLAPARPARSTCGTTRTLTA
jgi:heme O synthase-like polyprenyltransferase